MAVSCPQAALEPEVMVELGPDFAGSPRCLTASAVTLRSVLLTGHCHPGQAASDMGRADLVSSPACVPPLSEKTRQPIGLVVPRWLPPSAAFPASGCPLGHCAEPMALLDPGHPSAMLEDLLWPGSQPHPFSRPASPNYGDLPNVLSFPPPGFALCLGHSSFQPQGPAWTKTGRWNVLGGFQGPVGLEWAEENGDRAWGTLVVASPLLLSSGPSPRKTQGFEQNTMISSGSACHPPLQLCQPLGYNLARGKGGAWSKRHLFSSAQKDQDRPPELGFGVLMSWYLGRGRSVGEDI
jgi:hypothetical protein